MVVVVCVRGGEVEVVAMKILCSGGGRKKEEGRYGRKNEKKLKFQI